MRPLASLLLLAATGLAQRAGQTPPLLTYDSSLGDCPQRLDWASLQGTTVFISFAFDVTPDDIREMNWVASRDFDGPVLFINIVGGSEFLLRNSARSVSPKGCVVFDSEDRNLETFDLPDSSATIVINDAGVVAGYLAGAPSVDQVSRLLNHETPLGMQETAPVADRPTLVAIPFATGGKQEGVHISPSTREVASQSAPLKNGRYFSAGQTLVTLISDLWQIPASRMLLPPDFNHARYDVVAYLPASDDRLALDRLRQAVTQYFGVSVEPSRVSRKVYVLQTGKGRSELLQAAKDPNEEGVIGGDRMAGAMFGTSATMSEIADHLEDLLGAPVVDETGLAGKYDYFAEAKTVWPAAGYQIARQLGLELVFVTRTIDVLHVAKFR